ncbi:DNA-binding protein [Acinetobacter indicus]|uniref:helix-turn-helix domain-containing protein n=1 Tax=Acinetobacter indicus TaxID=756892 RepID=UPI0005F80A6C|nr:helix-turn-helix domain-containing protein [Acinetobacter indicus]KJV44225.1 DNA-binding protein [Acinetobacter indicus]
MRTTHQQQVLEHLKDGKTITQADAIHLFNCYRLGAVILQLRQLGYDIVTHKVRNTTKNGTYARYELQGE